MKNFRLLFLLAAYFLMGSYALAQPVSPTISPADGSADVWYYIKFAERDWPMGSGARYMYDAGDGKALIATQPAISDNLQWKVEETATAGEYRIVSKIGNGIEYFTWGIQQPNSTEPIDIDRYYTSATSTQHYVILPNRTDYFQIRRTNGGVVVSDGSIDKNNMRPEFDTWKDDVGNSVLFLPVATTTLTPPSPSLVAYPIYKTDPTDQPIQPVSSFNFAVNADNPSAVSNKFYVIGNNIPNATIAANITGTAAAWFQLSKTLTTGSDGVISTGVQILFAPPVGTPAGTYSATLTLSAGAVSAKPITLNGSVVVFPFNLSDDTNEYWYYLNTPVRAVTGNVIADIATDANPAVLTQSQSQATTKGDPKLLWKIVRESAGNYLIINKATNNFINYNKAGGSNFSTGSDSCKFSFAVWTGATPANCWRFICNDPTLTGNKEVNKRTSGATFSVWGDGTATSQGAGDDGNAIKFIAEGAPEADLLFPQPAPDLSSGDTENWYQILFARNGKAIYDTGLGADRLKQTVVAGASNQYWKLVGTDNTAITVESFAGNVVAWNAGGVNRFAPSNGTGAVFSLAQNTAGTYPAGAYWMLKNNADGNFINDVSGNGQEVGGWGSQNDPGSALFFSKVPATFNVGASALTFSGVTFGTTKTLSVDVVNVNTGTQVAYEIVGTDAAAFVVDPASAAAWKANRGGKLSIIFTPTSPKTAYSATLNITANGETKAVALSGNAIPFITSPADGSADVFYYIKFAQRDFPVNTDARYMYDAGSGKALVATQPLAVTDNLQWKIVETGTPNQYRIVSKNNNGIEYHPNGIGDLNLAEVINGDSFYTLATSTSTYAIENNGSTNPDRSAYFQIRRIVNGVALTGNNCMDKSNSRPEFGTWQNDAGNSVLFSQVDTTTLTPPSTTPMLKAYQSSSANPTPEVSSFSFATPAGDPSTSSRFNVIGYNIPDATIAADFAGDASKDWFTLTKSFATGSDGALAATVYIVFAPPAGTPLGNYTATLTLSAGGASAQPITLNATVTAFPNIVLSSLDNSDEHWYYLNTPARMKVGNVIGDITTGANPAVLAQAPVLQKGDPKLLWKIVRQSPGNYLVINKATSNYINYGQATANTGKFSTGSVQRTFVFVKWTGTSPADCWRFMCNGQGEINKDDNTNVPGTFGSWGNGTTTSQGASDVGNAIKFIAEDSPEVDGILPPAEPELSSGANEVWYRIVFNKTMTNPAKGDGVVQEVGLGQNLIQTNTADTPAQYWKFVGTDLSSVVVESYAGNQIGGFANGHYASSATGAAFTAMLNPGYTFWMLKDNATGNFLNDFGANGTEVGGWTDVNDNGSVLIFNKVPAIFNVSASALDFGDVPLTTTKALSVDAFMVPTTTTATYTIVGADAAAFTVDAATTVWNANRGGTLSIIFTPTTAKAYSATLNITANGETKAVTLLGAAVIVNITTPSVDDPVVSVKYYNLQGVEIANPSEKGVYIVKKTHASQQVTVSKELRTVSKEVK